MKIETTSLLLNNEIKVELSEVDELRADVKRFSDLVNEACEIGMEAQQLLDILETRPKIALLVLEDYLKEIVHLCSL